MSTTPTHSYPPINEFNERKQEKENVHVRSGLEEYERSAEGRPPWMLTTTEAKLLGIAGIGFFLDGEFRASIKVINFSTCRFLIWRDIYIPCIA